MARTPMETFMTAQSANVTTCENCATPLQGEYCHQCGQSVHNPVRHAGHAIEEFFEAFWHLDGRLWRTLRDLMVPGRTATNYLAGHRARYIPPLRLFVVLSVLTFFLGALTIHVDSSSISVDTGVETEAITQAQTIDEVQRERDRLLAEIEQARAEGGNVPGVDPALIAAQVKVRGEAANRIAELRAAGGASSGENEVTEAAADESSVATDPDADSNAAPDARTPIREAPAVASGGELFSTEHAAWDPEQSPVDIAWLPAFANDWLTRKMGQARDNIQRMDGRADLWIKALMASVPSALFVLVPLFALLLKLAYLFKRRLYLEHLVVALYSHVFLLLALTVAFVLSALDSWVTPLVPGLGWVFNLLLGAVVLVWMPVYLLLMQKRVYGQGWWWTAIKYLVIGFVYFYLLGAATAVMFVIRLAQA